MDEYLNQPRSPASPISFTFDLMTDWKHVLPYDTINGFSVHVDDPFTIFGEPIAVPAGMHAMIDISQPMLIIDDSRSGGNANTTILGPCYSRGYLCKEERYAAEIVLPFMGCG